MTKKPKKIWDSAYIGLFDNGTIGISDGVGYIDTMERHEVKELYKKS